MKLLSMEVQHFFKDIFLNQSSLNQKSEFLDQVEFLSPGPLDDSNNEKFRLLIDCDYCLDRLYGGFFTDFQSGGQWTAVHQFYEQMKTTSYYSNMEIIFFLNGTFPENGEKHLWLSQQEKVNNKVKDLYENFDPTRRAANSKFIPPAFLKDMIRFEADAFNYPKKSLFTFQSTINHQQEILDFAHQFKCDALFTNDLEIITLYLINQNLADESQRMKNLKLYEASSFKLPRNQEFQGKSFNFPKILDHFGMQTEEFVWFIILMGTRFCPSYWLENFYEKISRNKQYLGHYCEKKVNDLKDYVKNLKKPIDIEESIHFIINGSQSNDAQFMGKKLMESYNYFMRSCIKNEKIYWFPNTRSFFKSNYYAICRNERVDTCDPNMSTETWIENNFQIHKSEDSSKFINKLRIICANSIKSPFIYQILAKRKFYLNTISEPINEHNKIRGEQIFKPLRTYLYSIIFSGLNSNCAQEIVIEEIGYDYKTQDSKTAHVLINPLWRDLTMEDLWKKNLIDRMIQFYKSIKLNDMIGALHLPPNCKKNEQYKSEFFIPCCALRYLIITEKLLSSKDIDAFLITFIFTEAYQKKVFSNCEFRNSRAMHLANLFMCTIEHISFANDVCGNPIRSEAFGIERYFNGVFFQIAYGHCMTSNKNFFESYLKDLDTDGSHILKIQTELDKLRRFVYHKLENVISDSLENTEYHSKAQYEAKVGCYNNVDKYQRYSHDVNMPEQICKNEFRAEKILEEKISPRNNFKPMGRGILGFKREFHIGPKNSLEDDRIESFQNNDARNRFLYNHNNNSHFYTNRSKNKRNLSEKTSRTECYKDIDENDNQIDYASITFLDSKADNRSDLKSTEVQASRRHQIKCDFTEKLASRVKKTYI